MEKKLEKSCEPENLIVGERYCISSTNIVDKFIFIVDNIENEWVNFTYLDGSKGSISVKNGFHVYEFTLSSLEKELL